MTNEEQGFLNILCSALDGGTFDGDFTAEEWNSIFGLANIQLLLPIVFEAVCGSRAAGENPELFKAVKGQVIKNVVWQLNRNVDFRELYSKLCKAGLHPIVIKGQLCSTLYPLPDHRISSDDDLLVSPAEYDKCRKIFESEGILPEKDDDGDSYETSYVSDKLRIELHRSLFDDSGSSPDDFNRFFADAFDTAVKSGDYWSLSAHEHLLYLLLHSFKHFTIAGVGIRQTCDIGFWMRAHFGEIDWERLRTELASVHAERFAAAQFGLLEKYLGFEFGLPVDWREMVDSTELEPMLADMFEGGSYGSSSLSRLHSSTAVLSAIRASRSGKGRSGILRSIFPKYSYIAGKYPYVKRCPLLLPIGWLDRLVHYAAELKTTDSSASGSLRIARERVELLKFYDVID